MHGCSLGDTPAGHNNLSDSLHRRGIASAQEDPGAFTGKGPRDRAADGTARAINNCVSIFKQQLQLTA